MSILVLVFVLLFLAGIGWLVQKKLPALNPTIRWIILAILVISAVVITLNAFGLWEQIKDTKVPRL